MFKTLVQIYQPKFQVDLYLYIFKLFYTKIFCNLRSNETKPNVVRLRISSFSFTSIIINLILISSIRNYMRNIFVFPFYF